jgi:O-antigen/teichoic acid export membrane protein
VTTLRILLVLLVLQSPWLVGFGFVGASNRHGRAAVACLASSLIGLGVAAVLVRRYGIAGVAAGLVAGDALACSHFVLRESCRLVGEPYWPFARRLWPSLAAVFAVALLAGWLCHVSIGGPALVRWCAVGFATTAATAVTTWIVWLTPDTRRVLGERLSPLVATVAGARA